jgi:hypothetical protein
MLRRSLFVILGIAAACASSPERRQRIVAEETARLRPPETPLTAFGGFELLPIGMSADVSAKPEKVEVANGLGRKLEARLQPVLQEWTSMAPASARSRTLVIQPTVVSLRVVGGAARFWAGALAGDSFIDLDLALVEKQSGRVIAKERINKSSSAMAGAWSIGSTDQNLTEYVVDIAYQYLVSNHP